MAHLDLAAAGLTFLGACSHFVETGDGPAVWFSLAVMAKETAVLAPFALFSWNSLRTLLEASMPRRRGPHKPAIHRATFCFPWCPSCSGIRPTTSVPDLSSATRNSSATTCKQPCSRFVCCSRSDSAVAVVGYLNLYFLSLAAAFAMWLPPLRGNDGERKRIALDVQFSFLAVITALRVCDGCRRRSSP